ncbi:Transcriptional regulator, IclR family [Actinomycetales bacterium JB111]|nr:Transcriptional regulator, IclR family [Actinomycetales bacterium JB111]
MARMATGESSLARAVRLLDCFHSEESSLTVGELAARAKLPTPTASRLIAELVRLGLLERTQEGRVRPGIRLWEIASRSSATTALRAAAMPILRAAHAAIGQHLHLAVLDGDEVLFIERLSAPCAVINYSLIAGRLAPHTSSAGMILLAYAPDADRERVLAGPLPAVTRNTVTDPARLREVLATARSRGYVINDGHLHPDAAGVAVPVMDRAGRLVAALSAVLPSGSGAAALPVLRRAAAALGQAISSAPAHPGETEAPKKVSQLLKNRWGN